MLNLHIERKKKELENASRKRKGRRMQEELDRLYYGENNEEVKKNMEDFIREHEQVPEYQPLISEYRRLRGEIRQINLRITNPGRQRKSRRNSKENDSICQKRAGAASPDRKPAPGGDPV